MAEFAGLSPLIFWIAFATIAVGCAVQRLSGQGYGLIAAPVMAMIAPELMPTALLLLGFVAGIGSAALDIGAINRSELPWGFSGRALGALIAASIASLISFDQVATLVAVVVLIAVALSVAGVSVAISRGTLFSAGIAAGIMGTLTAAGAPPMAMLYQNEEPVRSRAMQSTFFLFGMAVSLLSLWVVGLVTITHLRFAIVALPAVLIGIAVSQPLSRYTDPRLVRPIALGLSTAAALVLLLRVFIAP